nr:Uvs126 [uncultured bacterium]
MADQMAHFFALSEESCAPARSPAASLPLTCAANTIDTMPKGRQQNNVDRMAHTRWLGMYCGLVFMGWASACVVCGGGGKAGRRSFAERGLLSPVRAA